MDARRRKRLLAALVVVAAVAVAAVVVLLPHRASAPPIAGMVRQTEIRIAPEISGRLVSIPVRAGQSVRKGELLAVLDNPDLTASLGEAKAAAASARAERDRIYSGVRAEEVAILAENMQTAEANLLLAEQQNARSVALAARDFASRQELDESKASLAKAQADLDLKRARHAAASAGPIAEERALANARVVLVEATVADLQAKLDKTRLLAPADGTVGILVAELGEIVPVGKPVLTLDVGTARWFAFTLREDALKQLTVGSDVTLTTDDGRRIAARVTELRPLVRHMAGRARRR